MTDIPLPTSAVIAIYMQKTCKHISKCPLLPLLIMLNIVWMQVIQTTFEKTHLTLFKPVAATPKISATINLMNFNLQMDSEIGT